ncbi:gamma-butyrobetaine dioxygenase-like [Asterias amurensis]|uniref:gamma-butyrobetaine dioxygenase-like n=1 Tax=Asterias amurensis TaxID=7602 RepID=UPI003AB371DF
MALSAVRCSAVINASKALRMRCTANFVRRATVPAESLTEKVVDRVKLLGLRQIYPSFPQRFSPWLGRDCMFSTRPARYSTQSTEQDKPSPPKFNEVTRDDSARWYRMGVDNGYEGRYPYVWLRDNCRCSQCYHPSSWQRSSEVADLDPDVIPSSEELIDDGRVLRVIWPDGHRSEFSAEWLNRQRFSESEKDVLSSPELQTWAGELNGNIPTFKFEELMNEDEELYNWLNVLNTKGLAVVSGAPTETGVVQSLAERVAFVKTTTYGDTFQVFSKHEASNLAYTPKSLCLHIDLPYYKYTPGIQMLHCIEQADCAGGQNQFVDGLNVSLQVKKEFPDTYKFLRTHELDFRDAGVDYRTYHMKYRRPVIEHDKYGDFLCVNYNDHVRAPYMSLPVEKVTEMYKAIKIFNQVMYRPGNFVQHRLAAGEIATFNNGRVLHGRSGFTITKAGNRHLEGTYFDWDETYSRMRIIREKLFGDERL